MENYPYGGTVVQTLPYPGVLHGADVPADPDGLIKLLAKQIVVDVWLVPAVFLCCLVWRLLS